MASYCALTHTRHHTRSVPGVPGSAKRQLRHVCALPGAPHARERLQDHLGDTRLYHVIERWPARHRSGSKAGRGGAQRVPRPFFLREVPRAAMGTSRSPSASQLRESMRAGYVRMARVCASPSTAREQGPHADGGAGGSGSGSGSGVGWGTRPAKPRTSPTYLRQARVWRDFSFQQSLLDTQVWFAVGACTVCAGSGELASGFLALATKTSPALESRQPQATELASLPRQLAHTGLARGRHSALLGRGASDSRPSKRGAAAGTGAPFSDHLHQTIAHDARPGRANEPTHTEHSKHEPTQPRRDAIAAYMRDPQYWVWRAARSSISVVLSCFPAFGGRWPPCGRLLFIGLCLQHADDAFKRLADLLA